MAAIKVSAYRKWKEALLDPSIQPTKDWGGGGRWGVANRVKTKDTCYVCVVGALVAAYVKDVYGFLPTTFPAVYSGDSLSVQSILRSPDFEEWLGRNPLTKEAQESKERLRFFGNHVGETDLVPSLMHISQAYEEGNLTFEQLAQKIEEEFIPRRKGAKK